MAETTIRIKIGSRLHNDLIKCLEQDRQWSHGFALWDIADIKRLERSDFMRVLLTNNEDE